MLATKVMTPKEHVDGYYKVTETPWATDYVWVPAEQEVEGASLTKFSIPGRRPTPSGSSKSGYIPKNRHGWRWKHSEEGEAAPGRRLRVEPQFVLLHPNLSHYYPASYQAPLASEATRADPASARYYAVR